ncbi:phytanoyl-CoA dioxygenase [Sphingomonas oleivorans]|uniref:Phytanoyl-CoA dioxygenase n=1 Tax=Sphingomonas oleivorans TaxID=1735121 RepID=A0A2T5FUQ7_9SPHN|nr:phytanoyl-CoA dioxygenase family protein [Sphingomonas oleivorans]PTQ08262.1 phytanoyl-CoA dioxygenase [Sphingomonas oleivorans]
MFATATAARASGLADEVEYWASTLLANGYAMIPHAIDRSILDGFHDDLHPHFEAAPFCQGPFYGETTKRFGRVLIRSPHAAAFAQHELILGIARRVLLHEMCNTILLNLTQAIEIHPGAPLQFPHRDQDMFGGPKGGRDYMMNVMWALDDFTDENGATRVWPGSNHSDPHGMLPEADAISAVMPRGSAFLFLGSALHSGGENRSDRPRRGVIFSYCQGWLRPWENPWLAYPPDIARHFNDELAALAGYRQHLPSLGNFEGQCPSVLLHGEVPRHLRFTDALRADQMDMVRQYQREHGSLAVA